MEATPKWCGEILPSKNLQVLVQFGITKEVQIRLVKLKIYVYKSVKNLVTERLNAIRSRSSQNQTRSIRMTVQNNPQLDLETRRTPHSREKSHICQFCKKGFIKNSMKINHEKMCRNNPKHDDAKWLDENKNHKCHLCNYTSWYAEALRVHLRRHLGQKPFACYFCTYKSSCKADLNYHIATHTREKPFKCLQCDYSAAVRSTLKTHAQLRHSNAIRNKYFPCNLCVRSFHSKSGLYAHILRHTGETPFICQFCKKGLRHIKSMNGHEKICKNNPNQKDKNWVEDQKVFKCESCPYSSFYKSCLTAHLTFHTGKKPFQCSQCSYRSSYSSNLKRHSKRHAEGKKQALQVLTQEP